MKDKIFLVRMLVIAAWVSILMWNGAMFLVDSNHHMPQTQKDLLLSGVLIWFVTILFGQNANDDDWAGEF